MNGGIGFSVEAPLARLDISAADRTAICDSRPVPMGADEQAQLIKGISHFADMHKIVQGVHIEITGAMRTHVGMGSATALRLGSIEGLAKLNGLQLPRDALIKASGRGGTSGIGINSYFEGGMICDLGRAADGARHAPSSIVLSAHSPLALPMIEMPPWPILLCIPRAIVPKSQIEEIAFFSRTAPLPAPASFKACYIALFGIYAAVRERNYTAFCDGIDAMQDTDWKRAERAEYGDTLAGVSTVLRANGADCVGMSSLGPMLFCFAPAQRMAALVAAAHVLDCDSYLTVPANQGREVIYNDA
ncbi:Beta-ribofuranosylaminobenzene 5'-phosphate synthase family [Magnetospirillum sp. LM-5]|nr:Beta-ribofuranosylaminobenzene 5'-phosphate synthase family [Magnetospirillum sp. LM-5]